MTGSDHCFHTRCPFVCPHFSKSSETIQVFTAGRAVGWPSESLMTSVFLKFISVSYHTLTVIMWCPKHKTTSLLLIKEHDITGMLVINRFPTLCRNWSPPQDHMDIRPSMPPVNSKLPSRLLDKLVTLPCKISRKKLFNSEGLMLIREPYRHTLIDYFFLNIFWPHLT